MDSGLKFSSYHLVADPARHAAAYGARLIWAEVIDGGAGVVHDRQDSFGAREDVESLFPLVELWTRQVREAYRAGALDPGSEGPVEIEDGPRRVAGGPQRSFGYLYVTAVLEMP